jgi:hypothetical protein
MGSRDPREVQRTWDDCMGWRVGASRPAAGQPAGHIGGAHRAPARTPPRLQASAATDGRILVFDTELASASAARGVRHSAAARMPGSGAAGAAWQGRVALAWHAKGVLVAGAETGGC